MRLWNAVSGIYSRCSQSYPGFELQFYRNGHLVDIEIDGRTIVNKYFKPALETGSWKSVTGNSSEARPGVASSANSNPRDTIAGQRAKIPSDSDAERRSSQVFLRRGDCPLAAILPDAGNKRTARVSQNGRRDPHKPNNRPQIASLLFYRAGDVGGCL